MENKTANAFFLKFAPLQKTRLATSLMNPFPRKVPHTASLQPILPSAY